MVITDKDREFIDFAVEYDFKSIKVSFAQNDEAEQSYDIFDANKLFATTGVIEPYFVTDGISLVKEEVKELPYYATLNIRSYETDTVRLVAKNIPEEYSISLIDGEQTIDMVEGDMYEVVLEEGENADRFKLLVKKSLSIADVEETQLAIINHNRHINILSQENMNVEVYNALGQMVKSINCNDDTVQINVNDLQNGMYIVSHTLENKEVLYYKRKTAATKLSIEDITEENVYIDGNFEIKENLGYARDTTHTNLRGADIAAQKFYEAIVASDSILKAYTK